MILKIEKSKQNAIYYHYYVANLLGVTVDNHLKNGMGWAHSGFDQATNWSNPPPPLPTTTHHT